MKNMKDLLPIKDYAESMGVSTNTIKNWANEDNRNFDIVKAGSRNYVKLHEMKSEISEKLLAEKEIEIQKLKIELQGKAYEIKGLEKQTIIIGMQQQMTVMSQNNNLLLETSKYHIITTKFMENGCISLFYLVAPKP